MQVHCGTVLILIIPSSLIKKYQNLPVDVESNARSDPNVLWAQTVAFGSRAPTPLKRCVLLFRLSGTFTTCGGHCLPFGTLHDYVKYRRTGKCVTTYGFMAAFCWLYLYDERAATEFRLTVVIFFITRKHWLYCTVEISRVISAYCIRKFLISSNVEYRCLMEVFMADQLPNVLFQCLFFYLKKICAPTFRYNLHTLTSRGYSDRCNYLDIQYQNRTIIPVLTVI